jgi:hypothetical protein
VGAENDPRALVDQILDGWQSGAHTCIVCYPAILQRDVEINTDQYFSTLELHILNGFLIEHRLSQITAPPEGGAALSKSRIKAT